jgi:hypothetical protein
MKYSIREKKNPKNVKALELPMAEVDEWEKKNPEWEIIIGAPMIVSSVAGAKSMKTQDSFKDKIKTIDQQHPGNTLRNFVNV